MQRIRFGFWFWAIVAFVLVIQVSSAVGGWIGWVASL